MGPATYLTLSRWRQGPRQPSRLDDSARGVGSQVGEFGDDPRTYEITFAGEAVPAIASAFEDFDLIVGAGTTTLRAQLPDQAALHVTLHRLVALHLELLQVRAVDDQPPDQRHVVVGTSAVPSGHDDFRSSELACRLGGLRPVGSRGSTDDFRR